MLSQPQPLLPPKRLKPFPHPHPQSLSRPLFPLQKKRRIRIQIQLPHPHPLLLDTLLHPQFVAVKSLMIFLQNYLFYGISYVWRHVIVSAKFEKNKRLFVGQHKKRVPKEFLTLSENQLFSFTIGGC